MTEVLFYELTRQPLERALTSLLEKSLERGWRAVVQGGSEERLKAIDAHLWTWRDDAFLAHGTAADGHAERQPVYLTTGTDNPNGAQIRFLVDGAELGDLAPYQRAVYIFDGNDEEERQTARRRWTEAKSEESNITYWKQSDSGRWEKQA